MINALYFLRLFCSLFQSFNGHIARYAPVFATGKELQNSSQEIYN